MNKEFFVALDLLEKEKGIPKEYMLEKIESALLSAFKKEVGNSTMMRVNVDPVKEDVKVYLQKEVVEEVENPQCQISLEEAKAISKKYTLGKMVETEVKTKNFRRLSAAAAKSVIIQGIREGERKVMQEAYESVEAVDAMNNAYGAENTLNLSDTSKLKLSLQTGQNGLYERDYEQDNHSFDEQSHAINAEYSYNMTDYLELSALGGMLFENDAVLGMNGVGGFSIKDSSTYFMGVKAALNLTDNISF